MATLLRLCALTALCSAVAVEAYPHARSVPILSPTSVPEIAPAPAEDDETPTNRVLWAGLEESSAPAVPAVNCSSLSDGVRSSENLLVDGSFECPEARVWEPIGLGYELDHTEYYFGVTAARVSAPTGGWGGVSQTITLPQATTRSLFVRGYAMFDDLAFPFEPNNPSSHALVVNVVYDDGSNSTYTQTFEGIPGSWVWVSVTLRVEPRRPFVGLTVQCVFAHDNNNSASGTAWFDALWASFQETPVVLQPSASASPMATATASNTPPSPIHTLPADQTASPAPAGMTAGAVIGLVAGAVAATAGIGIIALCVHRRRRRSKPPPLPDIVGPDFVPYKPANIKDRLLDRRSLYSVGTTLSERLRQWKAQLAVPKEAQGSTAASSCPPHSRTLM